MKSLIIKPRWRIALVMAAMPAGVALGSQNQVRAIAAANPQSTAWQAVIAADKAEISALNAATSAAMKKGDPNAVVAAQQLIVAVSARLANEKRSSSFPPGFQPATNTTGLAQLELKLELARDKAVADAIISADQRKIASINASVAKDMKAGKAQLVVADMSQLKTAQFQLAQDKSAAAVLLPRAMPTGVINQPSPFFHPGGLPIGGETVPQEQGHAVGDAIPAGQWPMLVAEAMKPVATNSIPPLEAELSRYQTNPTKLIGIRVLAYLKADGSGGLTIGGDGGGRAPGISRQARLQRLHLHEQITQHFHDIRAAARRRQAAEYRYQLNQLKLQYPGAAMWQVPPATVRQEQIERSRITRPAREEQRKDIRSVALAFLQKPDIAKLFAIPASNAPSSGAVYGIVVGISSSPVNRQTPALSLPSGIEFRKAHAPNLVGNLPLTDPASEAGPPGPAGIFLGSVRAEDVPPTPIAPCTVYNVRILYCGRSPHYRFPAHVVAVGPIKGYVFKLKSGTKMDAKTYTTGDFYYHLKWNGINLPVAKDLVVKITPVR